MTWKTKISISSMVRKEQRFNKFNSFHPKKMTLAKTRCSNGDETDFHLICPGLNGSVGAMMITDPHSGRSHTIHKDSGLYKDLLHKLHMAKVGDCIGDSDTEERPIRDRKSVV